MPRIGHRIDDRDRGPAGRQQILPGLVEIQLDPLRQNRAYRSPDVWSGCFFIPLRSWMKKK
jgi:hypothetical protein